MYSFESRVRYSECDATGRLSLGAMMNYLQDASTFQCEDSPDGMADLMHRQLGWILAVWQIEIDELPRFGEKIVVSTWCYDMKGLRARRNFTISDGSGKVVVRANSQWHLFDLAAHRVIRVPEDQFFYLEDTPALPMGELPRRVSAEGPEKQASPTVVTEHLLDSNHHVNNAQYVRLAVDALRELGHEASAKALTVQYRTMALLGDTVVPHVHQTDDGFAVDLASESGESYAIVRIDER